MNTTPSAPRDHAMPIATVAWAVSGQSKAYTRPAKFLSALQRLGAFPPDVATICHGRNTGNSTVPNARALLPSKSLSHQDSPITVLSPVFLPGLQAAPRWIDLYDDWALAPDINLYYRAMSYLGYRRLSRHAFRSSTLTCNSEYMWGRTGKRATIVPNGVDAELGLVHPSGDDTPRLLLLGHFFKGRTDFELLTQVAMNPAFEQIVVGSPGTDPQVLRVFQTLRSHLGSRLLMHKWLDLKQLAALAGPHTATLVPHVVRDYTISQDPMRYYQSLALGIRPIVPRMLWPRHLPLDHTFLIDFGVDTRDALSEWLLTEGPDSSWRQCFVAAHSWDQRAETIASLLS